MRMTKVFLTEREGFLLVSDGQEVARVRGVGPNTYVTSRAGIRLDVTPEPHDENSPWNHAIFLAQSVWMLRETNAIPDYEDIPVVLWYKQVERDYDWRADKPMSTIFPVHEPEDVHLSDPVPNAPTGVTWRWMVKAFTSSISAVSAGLAVVVFRHHKAVALPLLIGGASSYAVWTYDREDGWASIASNHIVVAVSSFQTACAWVRGFVVWILCGFFLLAVLYVAYRVCQLLNKCVRWMERTVEPSEIDSSCSSPPRAQPPMTPMHAEAVGRVVTAVKGSERASLSCKPTTIPTDDTIDVVTKSEGSNFVRLPPVPTLNCEATPENERGMPSPTPMREDGAGVFSSVSSAQRCEPTEEAEVPCDVDEGDSCLAHTVYPSDGLDTALSTIVCRADVTSTSLILGDEIVLVDGAPLRTPCLGGSLPLCAFHDNVYQLRSEGSRCYYENCRRRGFPWSHGGSSCITCSFHLQQHVQGSVQGAKTDVVSRSTEKKVGVETEAEKKKGVSWQTKSKTDEVFSESEAAVSQEELSESWSSQEGEIRKIFGEDVDSVRESQQREKSAKKEVVSRILPRRSPSRDDEKRPRRRRRRRSSLDSAGTSQSSDTSIESRIKIFRRSLSRRSPRGKRFEQDSSRTSRDYLSSTTRASRSSNGSAYLRRRNSHHEDQAGQPPSSSGTDVPERRQSWSGSGLSRRIKLPGFLRQPIPRGTEAPVCIRDDPKLHKRKKKGWECIADALSATQITKDGEKEPSASKLLERTVFAMRGFGQWHIEWGVGCYGASFTEFIRNIASDHVEDLRLFNVKCRITNRIAIGMSQLKIGSKILGQEDEKNLLLGDFMPVSNSVLEDHMLTDTKAESKPGQPKSMEMFRRCVENQINIWCLLFGAEYREEREECLYALLDLHDEVPELFTLNFLITTWEAFSYDYVAKMFDGMRKLGQFCRASDDIVEIRRLALNRHPDGGIIWQPPLSFDMNSSRGYWRLNIIPRLEAGVERQGYAMALERIVGKKKKTTLESQVGHENMTGNVAAHAIQKLYPLGEKLSKGEVNAALQNVPRKAQSGVALCLDFNAHSGCVRGNNCKFCHEFFGGRNLHWCVEAELIRRGGFRKRKNMIKDPAEARILIGELRDRNRRVLGEQTVDTTSNVPNGIVGRDVGANSVLFKRSLNGVLPILPQFDFAQPPEVTIIEEPVVDAERASIPWADDPVDVQARREKFNPSFPELPADFDHVDFTEKEQRVNDLIHCTDRWIYPNQTRGEPFMKNEVTPHQQKVSDWWNSYRWKECDAKLTPFILNWMDKQTNSSNNEENVMAALQFLLEEGSTRDKELASKALMTRIIDEPCVGNRQPTTIVWGQKEQLIDCIVEELMIGALKFHLVEYGDELDLSVETRKTLRTGNSVENNQCALVALGAGVEWCLQGRPNRFPSKSRVRMLAKELRAMELCAAKKFEVEIDDPPRQVLSAAHDATSYAHDRDIRCFQWFLLPAVRDFVQCPIRVIEVGSSSLSTMVHVFEADGKGLPMYLLAYRGHVRWALPTEYTRPTAWKNWESYVDRVVPQPTENWEEFCATADRDFLPDYVKCKYCPSWQKVEISGFGVGGGDGMADNTTNSLVRQSNEVLPTKPAPPMRRHSTGGPINPQLEVERFGPPTVLNRVPPTIPAPRPVKISSTRSVQPCATTCPIAEVLPSWEPDNKHVYEAFAGLGSVDATAFSDVPEVFPIREKEWRVREPHALAYEYHAQINRPYSIENLLWVIRAGTELMTALGGFGLACRHVQEINFRKIEPARLYLESKRACFPAVAEEVEDIFRIGVCPPFAETRAKGFDTGLPHNRKKSIDIVQSLWKDIQQAKVFVVDTEKIPIGERVEPCPTHTVLKRNPDRSWSTELRTISDLRRINNWIDKRDVFPVWVPGIGDVLKRIVELKRRYPSFKVWLAKRDLSNAFKRVLVHPDCGKIFMHQFMGEDFGISLNFSLGFLALPFGFLASPAYFQLVTSTIQSIHQSQSPTQSEWNDEERFQCFLYVDDAIFVESELGNRPTECLVSWEDIAKNVLGQDCINQEKVLVEGQWATTLSVLGFEVDTEEMTIAVPSIKIDGAATFVLSEEFESPFRQLRIKALQTLRGLMTHWLNAAIFWRTCVQPVDGLLSFADEKSEFVACPDPELLSAFWSMMTLLKTFAKDTATWHSLFKGKIERVLDLHLRFTSPVECKNTVWITGDATPNCIGIVNWQEKQFLRCSVTELMRGFSGDRQDDPIIAEIELITSVCGVVLWANVTGEQRILVVGTDNANVFSWLRRGKARIGRARRILTAFLLWTVKHGIEVIPYYLRTHHNLSADLLTRCTDEEMRSWMNTFGMRRVAVPWWWENFVRFGENFKWEESHARRVRLPPETKEGACDITVLEWNGSNFTPRMTAERFGCQTLHVNSRWSDNGLPYDRWPHWRKEKVEIALGTAKTVTECNTFKNLMSTLGVPVMILVTPSECLPHKLHEGPWTQHFWIDTATLSDALCGAWNVFICAPIELESLRQPSHSGRPSNIEELMRMAGFVPKIINDQQVRARRIENSQGQIREWTNALGVRFLHPASQLPPLTKGMVENQTLSWPVQNDEKVLTVGECLMIAGCHSIWNDRRAVPANEIADALWRSTPTTIWEKVLEELIDRKDEWYDQGQVNAPGNVKTEAPHVVSGQWTAEQFHVEDLARDASGAQHLNWSYADDFFSYTVGGPRESLMNVHEKAQGIDKIEALLSGLVEGTRSSYKTAWRHWLLFCAGKDCKPWLDVTKQDWDEPLLEFIMYENKILHLNPRTIRSKISGIRFFHLMAGRGDFATLGNRYRQLLKALGKQVPIARKLPISPEMFHWFKDHAMGDQPSNLLMQLWTAMVLGFCFLLRGAEIANLRWCDVTILTEEGQKYLLLCIRRSKTDVEGKGTFRSLFGNKSVICPLSTWESFLGTQRVPKNKKSYIFDSGMINRIRSVIKWIASSMGLCPKFFAAHSLRSGGASTLFANGIALEEIKRFGRWVSDTFHVYLYGDTLNLRVLSSALATDSHLLDQIRTANDHRRDLMPARQTNKKRKENQEEFSFRVGGATSEYMVRTRADRMLANVGRKGREPLFHETFDDEILHGLVDPKIEMKEEKEEVESPESSVKRCKEEILEKDSEYPSYQENGCPVDTSSSVDLFESVAEMSLKSEEIDVDELETEALPLELSTRRLECRERSPSAWSGSRSQSTPSRTSYGALAEEEIVESSTSLIDRTCTYEEVGGYEEERSTITATGSGDVMTVTDKRTVVVRAGPGKGMAGQKGSAGTSTGRVDFAQQAAYYEDQWRGMHQPCVPVRNIPVPRRPCVNTSSCGSSYGPSPWMSRTGGMTGEMQAIQPCSRMSENPTRAIWGPEARRSPTIHKGSKKGVPYNTSWPTLPKGKGEVSKGGKKATSDARESNEVDLERVRQAEELWTVLNNPTANSPENPEAGYASAVIVLAKKGLKFLSTLRTTKSFTKARQASKSWLRACKHKQLTVMTPEQEYADLMVHYQRRRTMLN